MTSSNNHSTYDEYSRYSKYKSIPLTNNASGYTENDYPQSVFITFLRSSPFPSNNPERHVGCRGFFARILFVLLAVTFLVFLFGKRPIYNSSQSCYNQQNTPWETKNYTFDPEVFPNFDMYIKGRLTYANVYFSQSRLPGVKNVTIIVEKTLNNCASATTYKLGESGKYMLYLDGFGVNWNVSVIFPDSLTEFGSMMINAPNSRISTDDLKGIVFDKVQWKGTNPGMSAKMLKAREIDFYTSGPISGTFAISKKLSFRTENERIDSTVEQLFPGSSQGIESIDLEVKNAGISGFYPYARAFAARTTNGDISLDVSGPPGVGDETIMDETSSRIELFTTNGRISGEFFVGGEWYATTSNGRIDANLEIPSDLTGIVRIVGRTSNGEIYTKVTDTYEGRFHLATSNDETIIKGGHDTHYIVDTKEVKSGFKGDRSKQNNELALFSSNGKVVAEFV